MWSCPSFNELTRDGQDADRWNLLHPDQTPRVPFVAEQLGASTGPVVASTYPMKGYAEQIRPFIPKGHLQVLGADGFARRLPGLAARAREIQRRYIWWPRSRR